MMAVMAAGGLHLSIDYGACTTTAILAGHSPTSQAVPFDGAALLCSGVLIHPDGSLLPGAHHLAATDPIGWVAAPSRLLHRDTITAHGRDIPVVDLVLATLSRVAGAATHIGGRSPDRVTLTVPASFGPRRRSLIRLAAARAGLPDPHLLHTPVAVARSVYATTGLPAGICLLICDLGGGCTVSVVRRSGALLELLAAIDVPDAGGMALDVALTEHLYTRDDQPPNERGGADPDPVVTLLAVAAAKEALSSVAAVSVVMPPPQPPTRLTAGQLAAIARPILDPIVDAAARAITAAELPVGTPLQLILTGGGSHLPELPTLLHPSLGLTGMRLPQPQLAAALGAVTDLPGDAHIGPMPGGVVSAGPVPAAYPGLGGPPPPSEPPAQEPGLPDITLAGGGILATVLTAAILIGAATTTTGSSATGTVWPPGTLPHSVGALLAAMTLTLGLTVHAWTLLLPFLRNPTPRHLPGAGGGGLDRWWLRQALPATAAITLTAAATVAVVFAAVTAAPAVTVLAWAVLPLLPPATAASLLGMRTVDRNPPDRQSWLAWLRLPPAVIALTITGLILTSLSTVDLNLLQPGEQTVLGVFGGLLLGAGVAWLITTRTWIRVAAAAPLAVTATVLVLTESVTALIVGYTLALGWWWTTRILQLQPQNPPEPSQTLTRHPASPSLRGIR